MLLDDEEMHLIGEHNVHKRYSIKGDDMVFCIPQNDFQGNYTINDQKYKN